MHISFTYSNALLATIQLGGIPHIAELTNDNKVCHSFE